MEKIRSCSLKLLDVFSSLVFGSSMMERRIESQITCSKRHWSIMVSDSNSAQEESENASNRELFEELHKHPKWGSFFYKFGEGELVIGKQFAEGSQGTLHEAQIEWRHPNWRKLLQLEDVQKYPDAEYVLKVFKEGTPLKGLKSQWPEGMLQFHAQKEDAWGTRRYACNVVCGTLLQNGCFAFVLQREHADLRTLIERKRTWKPWTIFKRLQHCGPFSKEVAEKMMYEVALGVDWLHRHDIVHKDLKASNVLVREENGQYYCFVADYECSVGVQGTGFFRAPEILQACKGRNINKKPELFSKEADVYSYGMTCYEVLTGKLPFEGQPSFKYDLVLDGKPLELPEYVDNWMRKLLSECWQVNPNARPSFQKILDSFLANSAAAQGSSSMHKVVPNSQVHWSHPKTEVFTNSELIRQYRTMVFGHTTLVKQEIGASKVHWSLSISDSDSDVDKVAEEDNVEVFKRLQMHHEWGDFFKTFGEGADDVGEMVIGQKFAEGGQASLYIAQVKWRDPKFHDEVLEESRDYALKVFKKGTSLQYLQLQWPQGMLQWCFERRELMKTEITPDWAKQSHTSNAVCGTLLEDGTFAFLFPREQEDLRCLIDRRLLTTPKDCGPFSKEVAERMMHDVALGMHTLHSRDIVHRDLKASNVLIRRGDKDGNYQCLVADFECSLGVIGTGFFRAPEILQAIKDRNVSQRPELFTKEADVYSYGMTCYEILTGKMPFEGHRTVDYDLVLNGPRLHLPQYVDDWVCQLLFSCWQLNPADRPSFGDILNLFSAHSAPMDGD